MSSWGQLVFKFHQWFGCLSRVQKYSIAADLHIIEHILTDERTVSVANRTISFWLLINLFVSR